MERQPERFEALEVCTFVAIMLVAIFAVAVTVVAIYQSVVQP